MPVITDDTTSSAFDLRAHLLAGQVIPAHPLALTAERRLDERHQRALARYYVASGAGGIAVGVHTTQFAIRECGLYAPVLELAAETVDATLSTSTGRSFVKVAGICGLTPQAMCEAETARSLGYHAGLLSLGALRGADDATILAHCRAVAEELPLVGFYLQPAVGGRILSYGFWREFFEIPGVVAVKIAPFNRYQTVDVVRALIAAGRTDVALYTGNDDSIVMDLLTPWEFATPDGAPTTRRFVGGLLGHWAVWTRQAVALLDEVKAEAAAPHVGADWLTHAAQITDANAVLFDAANHYEGCIPGIHEVLRRQGLLAGTWCLDPAETLSPGQADEIDRIYREYPWMVDDDFIAAHLDDWLT